MDLTQCSHSDYQLNFNLLTFWCVLNVVGDILVIALPLVMLWKLHMSGTDKLGLAVVFLLVLVIIIFDILRSFFNTNASLSTLLSSMVWTLCEPAIAVMVCALPSYRSILPTQSKRAPRSYLELLRESGVANAIARPEVIRSAEVHFISTVDESSGHTGSLEMNSMHERTIAERV